MSTDERDAAPTPEPDHPDDPGHADDGLDLARIAARSLAAAKGRPASRRRTPRRTAAPASGAHPDDRDPQLLGPALERVIGERGWGTDLKVHGVLARWGEIVGPGIAAHTTPEQYADGKLTVRTDSTAWAIQLRLLGGTIVDRLNDELGSGTVSALDVQGPNAPSWVRGRRTIRGARGPRDTYG